MLKQLVSTTCIHHSLSTLMFTPTHPFVSISLPLLIIFLVYCHMFFPISLTALQSHLSFFHPHSFAPSLTLLPFLSSLPPGPSSAKPSTLTSCAQTIMETSPFNYSIHACTPRHTQTQINRYVHVHSATENNTSSKTQRNKSSFHSLPATFNFKQVLLVLNMHSLHSGVS